MAWIDYYGLLNISQQATAKQIRSAFLAYLEKNLPQGMAYQQVTQAYQVLRNRYKRARYNADYGYLLLISAYPQVYPNAWHYQLLEANFYSELKDVLKQFKALLVAQYEMNSVEAEQANFHYQLFNEDENPRLLLRFPNLADRQKLVKQLVDAQKIREIV